MARRYSRTNLSIEERINLKEEEITKLNEQLKSAKSELKVLQDEKKVLDSQRVLSAIEKSGKSIDEVIGMLNPVNNEQFY